MKEVTFSFTASGNALYSWFVGTTSDDTGKLVASGQLTGAPITPGSGDEIKVTAVITLTG